LVQWVALRLLTRSCSVDSCKPCVAVQQHHRADHHDLAGCFVQRRQPARGDQLKLTFNETGKSTLNITGVNFNPAGLGLSTLTSGTDFIDNASTNKVLASLNDASSTLRGQASALGSNLSIVQIRQDFSKSLINVLQTGSSNLTLADTNEEAANSQALSTRQSIAVSALALANQSQQSVLQLLR
jgi:flagellin-like hook-associated protein FlgL